MSHDDQGIDLRRAVTADLDFAWTLYRCSMKSLTEEFLAWDDERQRAVIEHNIASGLASIIVAGDRDIGWMQVSEGADAIELGQLYIVPDRQNLGIGTTVVERLQAQARTSGKSLTLSVMTNNRARRFYERLGFVPTDRSRFKLNLTWRDQSAPTIA